MPTIEERLKLVISNKLGMAPSQISGTDNFVTDLGADSLDLVELVQDAEEEFNIEIPDEDAVNIHTVGDAYTYLVQHLPPDPTDPSDPPPGTPYERLKAIIVDKLGVDENRIVREASFVEDLGADSLDLVELVRAAEDEFDIEIPDEAAELLTTVGLAIDYIVAHI